MTDVVESPAGDAGEEPADPRHRGPGQVLAVSLAVAFAVATAVLAIVLLTRGSGESGRVTDLRRAAGQAAEALLTWDHTDLDNHLDAVLDASTGSFRGEYEENFERSLRDLITETESTARSFAKEIYVSAVDEERGQAIVVSDVNRDGAGGPRTLFDIYILLDFVHVDGQWKVDQLTDLNFDSVAGGGTGPTTTTSGPDPVP